MANKANLHSENLKIGYKTSGKDKVIIDQIDIALEAGKLCCLLGENGVGKSTLLKTFSGSIPPLAGSVYIDNNRLEELNPKQLAKKVSVVFTGNQRPGMLKVYEIVANGRYPYTSWSGGLKKEDLDAINLAIEMTQIRHLKDDLVAEISDGQFQKVMIARALAQDTDIILLDEPTAFLDIQNRLEIMQLLKTLAWETGKSILVSTHDLETAFHTADELWLATCCYPIVTGAPEDLIIGGQIAEIFDSDRFVFDPSLGMFRSNLNPVGGIKLTGEGIFAHWTRNALERIGYEMVEDATIQVEVLNEGKERWKVSGLDEETSLSSIEELVNLLRRK